MNKQELPSHLKQAIESIDDILKAAGLPLDLVDYSPEQVHQLEELVNLVESKQAKTYKEAGVLHRNAQNFHQLKEIALRHEVADEHIPDILKVMKLKVESLAEPQFELFRQVCQAMQSGMEMTLAAQMTLDKAKGTKNGKVSAQPKSETAIAKTNEETLTELTAAAQPDAIAALEVIPDQEALREKARQEAALDQSGFMTAATEEIFNISDELLEQGRNYGRQLYIEEFQAVNKDPEVIAENKRIIDAVARRRRPDRYR